MLMAFEVLTAIIKVNSVSGRVFRKVGTFEQVCGIEIPNDGVLTASL
jgi:hypothetical protein